MQTEKKAIVTDSVITQSHNHLMLM